jgi:exosortase/archaeosortase family protein
MTKKAPVIRIDNKKLLATLKFFIKLNLFAIPLYIILIFDLSFGPLQSAVRDLSAGLMMAIGMQPVVTDYIISIPVINGNWGAFISWDCTGWKSLLAFFALVMATPRSMKQRLYGLAFFLPLIFIINIVRIAFMFYFVGVFGLAYYDLVHAVIWSWGLITVVMAFWIVWMRCFTPHKARKVKVSRTRKN